MIRKESEQCKVFVKRLVIDSTERIGEGFGRKMPAKYLQNQIFFWKEIMKRIREERVICGEYRGVVDGCS